MRLSSVVSVSNGATLSKIRDWLSPFQGVAKGPRHSDNEESVFCGDATRDKQQILHCRSGA